MKIWRLLLLAIIFFTVSINAQESTRNAIGLRLGDSDGFGAEISFQRDLKTNNRLEIDFGWRNGVNYDGVKLVGLYLWVWLLDGDFNWYAGAGGGLSAFRIDNNFGNSAKDTFVFAAGNIGVEYNFKIPLRLSLDFRPELGFGNDNYDNNDVDFDIGLGVRYKF